MKAIAKIAVVLGVVFLALLLYACVSKKQASTTKNKKQGNVFIPDTISICSFNIQFLGSFKKRDNAALADIIKHYDIVVVQELVAPPFGGLYPNGEKYSSDKEAAAFFAEMKKHGFLFVLSDEDTGRGEKNHTNSTATEWWVAFYKPSEILLEAQLPNGFLAEDRSANPQYERVPHAFAFATKDSRLDFVLISVHLQPGNKKEEEARRKEELKNIAEWIEINNQKEKDFIILGDMNIYNQTELQTVLPVGYSSLNMECARTNTLINDDTDKGAKPYDHVFYSIAHTSMEIDTEYGFQVMDLIETMKPYWYAEAPYPGKPYNHNLFKQYYSDHHPVSFQLITQENDDD